MILFRASQIFKIMGDAQSIDKSLMDDDLLKLYGKKVKTDEEKAELEPYWDATLSAMAKTEVISMARQFVYDYRSEVTAKTMDKGIQCEDKGIELYNNVFFTNYEKNTVRKSNDWVTGECDILVPNVKTIDTKLAWSLDTFPCTSALVTQTCKESGYDWQGDVYMWLEDVPMHEVAYIMTSTPEELRRWESPKIHEVDHIAPSLRVTRTTFQVDLKRREKMKRKITAARKLFDSIIEQIQADHTY